MWNSGRLDYSELSNILPNSVKGVYFAKGTENAIFSAKDWIDKKVENLEAHGSPKVQDLADEES